MKLILAILLVLPTITTAQSLIPKALTEFLNLSPRCQRGDSQKLLLEVKYHFVNDNQVNQVKTNSIQYTKLCLENTAEGLVFEIVIDTLKSGSKMSLSSVRKRHSVLTDFEGYSFQTTTKSRIPVRDSCYDYGVPLAENMHYIEGYEFISMFIPVRLVEQLRYTAGRRLAFIGDTLTLALPAPICFQIPQVIERYWVEQKPFHLTLSGITSYGGKPCAIVKIESQSSSFEMSFASTDEGAVTGLGSTWITGEFLVSLSNGNIVNINLRERLDAELTFPNGTTRQNQVVVITTLTPRL